MERIALLGCTGSIGTQALNIVRRYGNKFKIQALVAGSNAFLLNKQLEEFNPAFCGLADINQKAELKVKNHPNTRFEFSKDAASLAAGLKEVDTVIIAVTGITGLGAIVEAIKNNKKILCASKEIFVSAGKIISKLIKENNVNLIPIDSEHSAIFQCLQGNKREQLRKIILTASGGPFFNLSKKDLENVTLKETLNHPKWKMGKKVTVDSATLMNKGLEVIEAKWLFDLDLNEIDCVVHPQSIIHSMVEFNDSSVICQLSYPDMELPIQYALTYPDRLNTNIKSLDLVKLKNLEFFELDKKKFPCYNLCLEALKNDLTLVLNAANETAVENYLNSALNFNDIPKFVECSLNKFHNITVNTLEDVFYYEKEVKKYTGALITKN